MKKWFPVLMVFAGLGSSFSFAQHQSQLSPIEKYIAIVRQHHLDPVAVVFAKDYGLQLDGARVSYGFANDDAGTWHAVKDLPVAYDNFEMDLINTAQIWKVGSQVVIEEWNVALDQGGFERMLYCFDSGNRLKSIDATNFQLSGDSAPFGMHERWARTADGKFVASVPFQYVDMQEKPVAEPKLAKDDLEFANSWGKKPPTAISLAELGLPTELLR